MSEKIITVDLDDNVIGSIEKLEAHKLGVLHRAFSVLVFNHKGEVLLQRRNRNKYHSPGLWSNTCCSHQRVGETLEEAVHRRMKEEMGFTCELEEKFKFIYKVEFSNHLMEHEIDHVFLGYYEGDIHPNLEEVDEYQWIDYQKLQEHRRENPEEYTYWFKILLDQDEMEKPLI